jgi:hypothetical protein
MNNNIPPEDVKVLQDYISSILGRKKYFRPQNPVRIRFRFNGEFFFTASGKTVWNNIGPAKAAIRHDFPKLYLYMMGGYRHKVSNTAPVSYTDHKNREEELYQEFLTMIEFVPA